jgi:NADH-quinone oxidoreductase subunit B
LGVKDSEELVGGAIPIVTPQTTPREADGPRPTDDSIPIVEPRSLRLQSETDFFPSQQGGVFTTTMKQVAHWGQANSIWPALFGLACCAIEMMAMTGPRWDLARFGAENMRASPRQSDLMIVAGRLSVKMAPVLRQIYDQMADPKWVISMGACASTGGVFNNYAIVQGVNQVIPVDVYVPGCPPRPEQLIYAILLLQKKIEAEHGTFRKVANLA